MSTAAAEGKSESELPREMSDELHVKYGGAPIVFLREKSFFGDRKPTKSEWLKHYELYESLSKIIDPTHLTGLQRVNGLCGIYTDNLDDKVALLAEGMFLRGKHISLLSTNPNRLDGEGTIRVTVKNIPLSVDDGVLSRTLILKGLEVISHSRVKLRINGRLTNCETGDRVFVVKNTSLKEPLSRFVSFGTHTGRVFHEGQDNDKPKHATCQKCLEQGHAFHECPNDWTCIDCRQRGHKRGQCSTLEKSDTSEGDTPVVYTPVVEQLGVHVPAKVTKPAATEKQKRSTVKPSKVINGQPAIDAYCTGTPGKGKSSGNLARSPPTPPETLNNLSKKTRMAEDVAANNADIDSSGET